MTPSFSINRNALFEAVTDATAALLDTNDWYRACDHLLSAVLAQSGCQYGLIGVVLETGVMRWLHLSQSASAPPFVKIKTYESPLTETRSSNIASLEKVLYDTLDTGQIILTPPDVDAIDAANILTIDTLKNLMCLPVYNNLKIVGVMLVANQPGGFHEADKEWLSLLTRHVGVICRHYLDCRRELKINQWQSSIESELLENKTRFQLLFKHSPAATLLIRAIYDGVSDKPIDWLCLDCNGGVSEIFGFDSEQIRGNRLLTLFPSMKDGPAHRALLSTELDKEDVRNVRFFPNLNKFMDAGCYHLPSGNILAIFYDVTQHVHTENANERAMKQLDSLVALSGMKDENTEHYIQLLAEHVANTLALEHVAVWLLNDAQDELVCQALFTRTQKRHKRVDILRANDFPGYFHYLKIGRPLIVDNVRTDSRTLEFNKTLFEPYNIVSMMDIPILIYGRVVGVVCHEHVGEQRHWFIDEQEYAASIANHIAVALIQQEHRSMETALAESEERLIRAIEGSGEWVWEWNLKADEVYWSSMGDLGTGDGAKPMPFDSTLQGRELFEQIHPDDRAQLEKRINHHVKHDTPSYHIEVRIKQRHSGQYRWYQGRGKLHCDSDGKPETLVGILRDITREKEAALEREQLIGELEAKNAELERFNYTVSHDLKSPLITIRGFAGLLEQDALNNDKVRMQQDITRILSATQTMSELLDDLLELSRVGRLINPFEEIDMNVLVKEALLLLEGQISQARAKIEVMPDLPNAFGDQKRLLEVWQNLIGNALKFMGDQPKPHIKIGARSGKFPVFYVADNGIGIEPKYYDKIFGLFERLRPEDFEGTGIGLALVKRIIELHHGSIWVEPSTNGIGSVFCFRLGNTI